MSQNLLFEFCLRLAAGLTCMTVLALRLDIGPPLLRTLMLVVLGLCVLGFLNGPAWPSASGLLLVLAALFSFCGFVFWTLGRPKLANYAALLLFLSVWVALTIHALSGTGGWAERMLAIATGISSALLLGSMVAAMLLGHTYLIAPTMSIDPLRCFLWCIAGSIAGRSAVACTALALEGPRTGTGPMPQSSEQFWWVMFGARWVIGLVGPAVLAWMVWQTARIRSTQSATGILYAGVILVFFGELVGQLIAV